MNRKETIIRKMTNLKIIEVFNSTISVEEKIKQEKILRVKEKDVIDNKKIRLTRSYTRKK